MRMWRTNLCNFNCHRLCSAVEQPQQQQQLSANDTLFSALTFHTTLSVLIRSFILFHFSDNKPEKPIVFYPSILTAFLNAIVFNKLRVKQRKWPSERASTKSTYNRRQQQQAKTNDASNISSGNAKKKEKSETKQNKQTNKQYRTRPIFYIVYSVEKFLLDSCFAQIYIYQFNSIVRSHS